MTFLPLTSRLHIAALMAITGGAVGQSLVLWPGSMGRFLPTLAEMTVMAALGGGMAGLVLADLCGRRGVWGAVCGALAWLIASALGSVAGAGLFGLIRQGGVQAGGDAAPLGMMALMDGLTTSPVVMAIWLGAGLLMHCAARMARSPLSALT